MTKTPSSWQLPVSYACSYAGRMQEPRLLRRLLWSRRSHEAARSPHLLGACRCRTRERQRTHEGCEGCDSIDARAAVRMVVTRARRVLGACVCAKMQEVDWRRVT